ncbi:TPA: hypothetical protein HA318_01630, partial [Candidatus Micrarchaeota archaeon]|nr:hypothetical protein [Candidatus Micrarchaeota archaeon]
DSVKGIREGEREAVYSMLVQSAAKGRITAEQAGERLSGLGRSEVGRAELEERLGLLPKKRVEERMKEGWTRFREKVRRK